MLHIVAARGGAFGHAISTTRKLGVVAIAKRIPIDRLVSTASSGPMVAATASFVVSLQQYNQCSNVGVQLCPSGSRRCPRGLVKLGWHVVDPKTLT